MRIISIDVGIKNLAFCILENADKEGPYNIIKWDVINLCSDIQLCNCEKNKAKNNKNKDNAKDKDKDKDKNKDNINESTDNCNKPAFYSMGRSVGNMYLCKIHANKSVYKIPSDDNNIKKINKMKIGDLKIYMDNHGILYTMYDTKPELLLKIKIYINENVLSIIKKESANQMNMIPLGERLFAAFNAAINLEGIDHICIENQIGPIANRMKSLQGMISMYFIMNGNPNISFISATNKLKLFKPNEQLDNHSERKKAGIEMVHSILEKNENKNKQWTAIFNSHKKKDDMADSLLQGLWYLKNNAQML
jgi:hypothetical protein